jgi:hypothetical protein
MFEGITEKDTQKLIELYQKTEAKIIEDLQNVNIANRNEKLKALANVQDQLERLDAPTKEFLDLHVGKEYKQGVTLVNQTLGTSFALINKEAIESLVMTAYDDIRIALGQSKNNIQLLMDRLTKEARNEVLQATGNALITGQARKGLSAELYKILKANGITGYRYTDKNGKVYNVKLETYVDRTARNALRDAQNEAVAKSSLEAGVDLVKFSTHSNPSPMCKPWQGRVVSISGAVEGYPTLQEARTWYKGIGMTNHANCRHRYVPYNKSDIPFVKFNPETKQYETVTD